MEIFNDHKLSKESVMSPNRQYYYKIKTPIDLYWGLYVTPISFFDASGHLVYYKHRQTVEVRLGQSCFSQIVNWSASGNIAYFIDRNSPKTYCHVLLDLKHKLVSKTVATDPSIDRLTSHLFEVMPSDVAQKVAYKIISTPASGMDEVMKVLLDLPDGFDEVTLVGMVKDYYSNTPSKFWFSLETDGFDDNALASKLINPPTSYDTDKLLFNLSVYTSFQRWRPR